MDGVDHTVTPVADEQRALILRGEFCTGPEGDSRRRPLADINDSAQTVRIICRPFSSPGTPPEFRTAGHMIHTRRSIPWRTDVPFHICVVSEKFAVWIECNVVLIAKSAGDQLPVLTIGADLSNPATRSQDADCMTSGIPHAWQQLVFIPVAWDSRT